MRCLIVRRIAGRRKFTRRIGMGREANENRAGDLSAGPVSVLT